MYSIDAMGRGEERNDKRVPMFGILIVGVYFMSSSKAGKPTVYCFRTHIYILNCKEKPF